METTTRQNYLDWLRILSILGVLLFHSAMPYARDMGWHIKNHETSDLMMEANLFMHLFRMPLLFFISGTVSYYMMQRRSTLSFIGLRFRRLFIPLLVGVFIIVPPQIYMEYLTHGFKATIGIFIKRFLILYLILKAALAGTTYGLLDTCYFTTCCLRHCSPG